MQRLAIPNYSVEELEVLLRKETDHLVRVRLMVILQLKQGKSSRALQRIYYKSHSRYCAWLKNFNAMGIAGLRNKPRSGRKPRLPEKGKEELKYLLNNKSPSDYGYNSSTWTGPLLIDYIKKQYGIEYKKAQIYNIIKSLGFSYQKGRPNYPEADPEKREEFKKLIKKNFKKQVMR